MRFHLTQQSLIRKSQRFLLYRICKHLLNESTWYYLYFILVYLLFLYVLFFYWLFGTLNFSFVLFCFPKCVVSDSEIPTSENLETVIMKTVQNIDPLPCRIKQQGKNLIQDSQKPCNIVHSEGEKQQYNKKVYNKTCFVLLCRMLKSLIVGIIIAVPLIINLALDVN